MIKRKSEKFVGVEVFFGEREKINKQLFPDVCSILINKMGVK